MLSIDGFVLGHVWNIFGVGKTEGWSEIKSLWGEGEDEGFSVCWEGADEGMSIEFVGCWLFEVEVGKGDGETAGSPELGRDDVMNVGNWEICRLG